MRSITKNIFVLFNCIIYWGFLNCVYLAETNQNSIIKVFCVENFRKEMLKAEISYNDEIANITCDCYLEEFLNSTSHYQAINKCKLETLKKFDL